MHADCIASHQTWMSIELQSLDRLTAKKHSVMHRDFHLGFAVLQVKRYFRAQPRDKIERFPAKGSDNNDNNKNHSPSQLNLKENAKNCYF